LFTFLGANSNCIKVNRIIPENYRFVKPRPF
jgi:hypothetical protein